MASPGTGAVSVGDILGETPPLSFAEWMPTIIENDTVVVRIPHRSADSSDQRSWIMTAKFATSEQESLREYAAQITFLLCGVRLQSAVFATLDRGQQELRSAQRTLTAFDHPSFFDAVPFALATGHDLGHLIRRMRAEVRVLKGELGKRHRRSDQIGRLQNVIDGLEQRMPGKP